MGFSICLVLVNFKFIITEQYKSDVINKPKVTVRSLGSLIAGINQKERYILWTIILPEWKSAAK